MPDFSSEDVVIQFDEPRELRKATGDSVGINLIRLNDQKFIVHDSSKVEIWELPAHDAEHRHSGDIADFLDVNTQLSSKVVYEHTFGLQKSQPGKEGNYSSHYSLCWQVGPPALSQTVPAHNAPFPPSPSLTTRSRLQSWRKPIRTTKILKWSWRLTGESLRYASGAQPEVIKCRFCPFGLLGILA